MNMQKYSNKKILVIGLGMSGVSASKFLADTGAEVTGYDRDVLDIGEFFEEEYLKKIKFILGDNNKDIDIAEYDLLVKSPGVPPNNKIIRAAEKIKKPVISELHLGLEMLPEVKVVAVTGTNGKTTTCRLIEYLTGGHSAGNIGQPLTSIVRKIKKDDIVILEVSSYQIVYTPNLVPDIGVLLNIFPEHIQWHGNRDNYIKAKKNMFIRQSFENVGIFNLDIPDLDFIIKDLKCSKLFFSSRQKVKKGIYIEGQDIVYTDGRDNKEYLMSKSDIKLPGVHNVENVMAACGVCKVLNIKKIKNLKKFDLPEHRLQEVGDFKGVKYINDSKATNMHSTLSALKSIKGPVILLMGGRSKGQFHPGIEKEIENKVIKIIAFGDSRKEIVNKYSGKVSILAAPTLKQAVKMAKNCAPEGSTVLLSPGGSSFDEFANYKDRGNNFKKWVKQTG
ncbi:MAG: UDP-N-acetylmuramoyl-L-alanine--D-glutamate ligase [Elusimicrobiota bacterium]